MTMDERKNSMNTMNNVVQNIVLENREKLSISGVLDVLSFDDQIVILETELGLLTVKGENLRINKLSLDTTEVVINGEIYNLGYTEKSSDKKNSGLLNKIFKKHNINILSVQIDETKLSIITKEKESDILIKELHKEFII